MSQSKRLYLSPDKIYVLLELGTGKYISTHLTTGSAERNMKIFNNHFRDEGKCSLYYEDQITN